jgi:hypothetical protein
MDYSKDDINWKITALKLLFILSYQGSLAIILFNSNPSLHEGNPLMKTILDHNPLGAIFLFAIVSLGLWLAEVKSNWSFYFLIVGSGILFLNFIRELILAFAV